MPQLKKVDVISLARRDARQHTSVTEVTLEQLLNSVMNEYSFRSRYAKELARDFTPTAVHAAEVTGNRIHATFIDSYTNAFADEAVSVWGGILDRRRRAVQHWQHRVNSSRTMKNVSNEIVKLLKERLIPGSRIQASGGDVTLYVDQSFSLGATVYFRFERGDDATENPENAQERLMPMTLKVEISWSSTGRSLENAHASIQLYQQVTDAAMAVKAIIDQGANIAYAYGFTLPQRVTDFGRVSTSTPAEFHQNAFAGLIPQNNAFAGCVPAELCQ